MTCTISALNLRFDQMEKQITETIENSIKEAVSKINSKIEELQRNIDSVEENCMSRVNAVSQRIDALEVNGQSNSDSGARILELERTLKLNDVVISGIPKQVTNLQNAFTDIIKATNTTVDHSSIGSMFRLRSGSIIVKFLTSGAKDRFFKDYLNLRNLNLEHFGYQGNRRVFINECLCKHTADLLKIANTMRKDGWISQVFTLNGYLFIKKTPDGQAIKIFQRNQLLSERPSDAHSLNQVTGT